MIRRSCGRFSSLPGHTWDAGTFRIGTFAKCFSDICSLVSDHPYAMETKPVSVHAAHGQRNAKDQPGTPVIQANVLPSRLGQCQKPL